MNLEYVKNSIIDNKKYLFIYLIAVAVFAAAMFTNDNLADWTFEAVSIPIIAVIGVIVIFYSFKKKMEMHKVALVLIIVFGLLMLFLAPPMAFPDEEVHFARVELLSEGIPYPQETDQGYLVNNYSFGLNEAKKGLTVLNNPDIYNPIDDSKSYIPTVTESPFYSYIFSAIGILLAKSLHLTAVFALFFARLANLLLYAGVAYYAIKKAPTFKTGLTLAATMPMVMAQVSSTSYDAFILTFTLLILAYFIKMYKDRAENVDLAIFFVSVLLISLIKPPYIALALMILAVPKENFCENRNYSFIGVILIFIITFLSVGGLLTSISSGTSVSAAATTGSVSLSGQVDYILGHPLILTDLMKHILVSIPEIFVMDLSFFHFADFNGLKFFNLTYLVFFVLFSAFYEEDINLGKMGRAILSLVFIVIYLGINAILYLQWTPVGSNVILGIQARYFVPVICLFPLIINYEKKSFVEYKYLMTFIVSFLAGLLLLTITHYY